MMMMKSVMWWRKPEYPEETTDLRQVTDDVASMTVAHGNRRSPGMFHPHEGRLEALSG